MARKFISLALALCMIVSCFAISGISVSAATAPDAAGSISGGQTIYFQPASNWKNDGARFALYYFKNSTNTNGFVNFALVTGESNTYQAAVPAGTWDGVIFVRMNGSNQTNNWDNKWNQSSDITAQTSGKNLYVQPNDSWDNWTGSWSTYTAQQPTTAAPTTTVQPTTAAPTTVDDPFPNAIRVDVGSIDDAPGSSWAAWTWNDGEEGTWVTIQSFGYVPVKSKVLFANFNNPGIEKKWDNVLAQTIDFDVQNHKMLTLSKTKQGNNYTGSWSDDGYFGGQETTAEPTTVAPTTTPVETELYLYGLINGENIACEEHGDELSAYQFENHNMLIRFNETSYIGLKASDGTYYATYGYSEGSNVCTMYPASVVGEGGMKLQVPGGVLLNLSYESNGNGSYTLSYYVMPDDNTTEEPTTEEPTTAAPTTVAPTTAAPTTVAPTTAPAAGVVDRDGILIVADDFNLILNAAGTSSVTGEIYLAAGQYKFKVQKDRVLYGYNKTVNDATTGGLSVKSTYNAQITLNATGGVYKFNLNKNSNALTIANANETPATYLVGDIHTILNPVAGNTTVAIGSMYIPAGSYDFKVSINGDVCGYNKTVNDTTNGGSISTNPKYGTNIKLVATGGMYTFTLNKSTKKLIIGYISDANESKTDVHVTGDISFVLMDNDGEDDVAIRSITLDAGTYTFKVYNYGVVYTIGGTIKDSGTKGLKTSYMSPVTLNATGGTYTFQFNKKNGYLTVSK